MDFTVLPPAPCHGFASAEITHQCETVKPGPGFPNDTGSIGTTEVYSGAWTGTPSGCSENNGAASDSQLRGQRDLLRPIKVL